MHKFTVLIIPITCSSILKSLHTNDTIKFIAILFFQDMLHKNIAYLQMAEWKLLLIFSARADKIHATLLAIYVGNKKLSLQPRWLTVYVKTLQLYISYVLNFCLNLDTSR
jgi:hypothetical protein